MFKKVKSTTSKIVVGSAFARIGSETIKYGDEREITIIIEGNCGNVDVNCGTLEVKGDINGDAEVDCGNLNVDGSIKGTCKVSCGNIIVSNNK